MTELQNLTVAQLRRIISIKEQIESLTAQLETITGDAVSAAASGPAKRRGVYKRSKAARAAMAAAQKARWAKVKGTKAEAAEGEAAPKKRRKMSVAAKAKMAAAAKARWAKGQDKAEGLTAC